MRENVNCKQDAATAAMATTNGDYFVAKQGQINVLSQLQHVPNTIGHQEMPEPTNTHTPTDTDTHTRRAPTQT